MQKRSTRSLQLAALLAASASAQTITSTIPICPTASSTTITMPTTVTFCPGPHCNGGASGPMITGAPHHGVGMQGHFLGDYTSVGADGKTTVLGIHETVYDSLCSTGLVPATWTITEECGCTEAPAPTHMPAGFETTVVPCTVCGPHSSMVTLTQPCSTGPYATQTPTVNQSPAAAAAAPVGQAPAAASAGAGAGASAGAVSGPSGASAGAGSGAGADAVAGTVSPAAAGAAPAGQAPAAASAGAGAGAGAGATAQGPSGASAGADSGSDAAAQVGADGASASAGAGAGASAKAGMVSPAGMMPVPANGTMPATNSTRSATSPMVSSYVSSATHASIAGFTIFAGVIAALLL
ncbi:hypothetical protein LTR70_000758 [Exophiala xenobiotica]|uniref:Uncharacterized protein n=1 Tax=Lithohypha guttulata TaxID=1690604 RepID=A0ABR0KN91_9EURO|nr:hypothetical protein LTR24_000570 [Lithohypha guttulata]KAK5329261.1 hypothetical protein LTR70_000758 [Exophiala xenobiotica]